MPVLENINLFFSSYISAAWVLSYIVHGAAAACYLFAPILCRLHDPSIIFSRSQGFRIELKCSDRKLSRDIRFFPVKFFLEPSDLSIFYLYANPHL